VTLREPDGVRVDYFDRFVSHGRLGDPNFFPLMLWGQYDMSQRTSPRTQHPAECRASTA